jgi:hypothetical protein
MVFVSIEPENRERMLQIIKSDKIQYPSMKFFVNRAIREKIEREYAFSEDEVKQLIKRIIQ